MPCSFFCSDQFGMSDYVNLILKHQMDAVRKPSISIVLVDVEVGKKSTQFISADFRCLFTLCFITQTRIWFPKYFSICWATFSCFPSDWQSCFRAMRPVWVYLLTSRPSCLYSTPSLLFQCNYMCQTGWSDWTETVCSPTIKLTWLKYGPGYICRSPSNIIIVIIYLHDCHVTLDCPWY